MNATKYVTTRTARGIVAHLEVEFTTRTGETVPVTGPIMGAHLKTSTKPRAIIHAAITTQGMAVCEAVGLSFWAVAEEPRRYFAVRDGQFYMVHHVIQRAIITVTPVDAWDRETGPTVEHPAVGL